MHACTHTCMYSEGQDWQKNKTLGALLGEEQDVTRRMHLAGLAFWHMFGLFIGVSASLELKICVWNALVRPVLLYGCGTWGLNAAMTEKHCALHRRHLYKSNRLLLAKHTCNEALYVQTDKIQPPLNGHSAIQTTSSWEVPSYICLLTLQHCWVYLQLLTPTSKTDEAH